MTTFYVGQRVRIVGAAPGNGLNGKETTLIRFDGTWWTTTMPHPLGGYWIGLPSSFEPILYDGNKTVEWS
jgi:hypothetical protein